MKKYVRKLMAFCLILNLFAICVIPVYATEAPLNCEKTIDGSRLTDEQVAESILYNRSRGNLLNRAVARISDNEDGTVNVYGAVMAGVVCEKLRLEMTLQRLEGNSWKNVTSYSDISYNQSLLTKSYNRSVKGGYYYRLKAACIATKGGTSESQMPVTNGIWID